VVVREGMKWFLLVVTTLSTYVLLVDPALTPLMIGTIRSEFEVSQTAGIWILNAYYIAFASFLLLGGRLCEILGFRNLYKGGAFVYIIGSFTCALSPDYYTFMIGRVIQGIGAGLNLPTIAAMIIASFPKEQRGRAISIDSGIAGLLVLISVFFSGFIIESFSWHALFVVYGVVSIIAIILSIIIVKPSQISFVEFPIFSPLILILGMVITTASLMEASHLDWREPIFIAGLIGGPLLLIIFVVHSFYTKNPLADFSLFRNPTFFWVNWIRMVVFVLIAASNLWVIYFGSNLGIKPKELGILIFVAQLPAVATSILGGYLSDRFSYRISIGLGFLFMIFAFSWMSHAYNVKDPWLFLPGLFAFTSAQPILISQSISIGLSMIPKEQLGSMSGLMATVQQFAQAIGLAFLLSIFVEIETRTQSDFIAFWGMNMVGVGFAVLGLILTLFTVPAKKL
jgi:MFS family permease